MAKKLRQFEAATLVEILRKFLEFLDLLMVKSTPSLIIHNSLPSARQAQIAALEQKQIEGYKRYPQQPDEVDIWLNEQVWEEE
jgi:hypothetical protein